MLCQLALGVGVWFGAYLQSGAVSIRYMGVQFAIAFIMVFVQDRGWTINEAPALERLAGILAGMGVLALTFTCVARIRRVRG
jgi:hypothetical protein